MDKTYTDVEELSEDIMDKYSETDDHDVVSVICKYEIAKELLKDLLKYENLLIDFIDIAPYNDDLYGDEYLITIVDGLLGCEKMKIGDKYISHSAYAVFIHQDCKSAVIGCNSNKDAENIFFDYEWENDDVNDLEDLYLCDDFECCDECCEDDDLVSTKNESVTLSRGFDGKVHGFSKTWSDNDSCGNSYYSSYSHYSSDEGTLREIASKFGVKI